MRAVQHVFRRGAVYWWRRRLFHKDGESVRAPIAFSATFRKRAVSPRISPRRVMAS